MGLFTIDSLGLLFLPSPGDARPSDPWWNWEADRRREEVCDEADGTDAWAVRCGRLAHETGRYDEAIGLVRPVADREANDARLRAQALFIQGMSHLCLAQGRSAIECGKALSALAETSKDAYVVALDKVSREVNREDNECGVEDWLGEADRYASMQVLADAAEVLAELGAIDDAIRAQVASARLRFISGNFYSGIGAVERATDLIQTHRRWGYVGRLIALTAGMAVDLGYRKNMEAALHRAIDWCDYLGDVFGRIEARLGLGRLLGYEMASGDKRLIEGPDSHLRQALVEAEAAGLKWTVASIDSFRAWLFRKAGDEDAYRALLGLEEVQKDDRELLASLNREAAEKITEQIRLQNASRLHDGIEDTDDAFFVYNALRDDEGHCRDFVCVYRNGAAKRLLAENDGGVYLYSEAAAILHMGGWEDAFIRAAEAREPCEDLRLIGEGDSARWFARRVVPSGNGVVASLRDVTAEKRIETALREAAQSAARSERAKSAFLASMSHEIRTPLNGVLGLARMLAETDLDGVQRGYVEDIVMSGDILLDLIGDVLDLTKIESQDMRIVPTAVNLPDTVGAIVKLFRGQAKERGTTLSYRIGPGIADVVRVDGVRLRQILSNLVGNAVKFTRNGKVGIDVSLVGEDTVFRVWDTGPGIPEDRLDTIFARFRQAGEPDGEGAGLGLTITKALTEMMGGSIWVESCLGQGSTFFVRLPLEETVPDAPAKSDHEALRFEGRRVLLVDDNRVNLLVSAHTLRKFGCEVVTAENGEQALDRLAEDAYDLVMMDVRMPVMNGLQATREWRRREGTDRRTPVVALTAGALVEEQQECVEAGMDEVAIKPIAADAIRDVLARWLVAA